MKSQKSQRDVLIGENEPSWHDIFRLSFGAAQEDTDCPYRFEVESAFSGEECLTKIRARHKPYDVIVLDIWMESELAGIRTARLVDEEFRGARPVIIIFTGHPRYETCVEVMRNGAWDYVVKENSGGRTASEVVIQSAIDRLRGLDLQKNLQQLIAEDWLPRNDVLLRRQYPNKIVALWHDPEISVIGSGADTFDLEDNLKAWRKEHQNWESPFFVKIPGLPETVVGE